MNPVGWTRSSVDGGTAWRRTVRAEASTVIGTPVARVLLVGSVVMAVVSGAANIAALGDLTTDEARQLTLHAATVPCLVFALISSGYAASSDRRFHLADQRLLSDPSRSRWLAGTCVVHGAIGAVYGLLGSVTAIAVASVGFAARGSSFEVFTWPVGQSLAGVVIAASLFAAIGSALGALVTNTPGVLAGLLAWVLVIEPPVVLGAPAFGRVLPAAGALALTRSPDPDLLSPLGGLASLIAYTVVAIWWADRHLGAADL